VPTLPGGFDLTDLENFAHGFPHDVFVWHRREAPVLWCEPTEHTPDGEGFWSVATHAETLAVLHDPETYSSERGGGRPYGGTILPDSPTAGMLLNMMDDPRHQRIRALVTPGLTPKRLAGIEPELRRRTRALLDGALARDDGAFDYLVDVAGELPMQVICILLGVPERDRHMLFECIEGAFDFGDRRTATDYGEAMDNASQGELAMRLFSYGAELTAEKRSCPSSLRDADMLSTVIHARLDGAEPPQLTDGEIQSFFTLLFAAGSDTTRNAAAGGLLALVDHPDQWDALQRDRALVPLAVEETVRWTAPAAYNRRTATRDTTLAGEHIGAGDKVVFWEASANRDERVFGADAMTFRVDRDPNPHLGFGHGIHFCLGANLARLELTVILEETLDACAAVPQLTAPVEFTRSNKHNGIRHLPIRAARRERSRS
jgi:cytochrome P450